MRSSSSDRTGDPPSREAIREAVDQLSPSADLGDARLLVAVPVGSWADDEWQPGDDVDLRAVYVLPPAHYLGLTSYRDELECVKQQGDWELDLVAFEIEKVARLMLKGHQPTLMWLAKEDEAIVSSPTGSRIRKLARARIEAGVTETIPPGRLRDELYQGLDDLVRLARLGGV